MVKNDYHVFPSSTRLSIPKRTTPTNRQTDKTKKNIYAQAIVRAAKPCKKEIRTMRTRGCAHYPQHCTNALCSPRLQFNTGSSPLYYMAVRRETAVLRRRRQRRCGLCAIMHELARDQVEDRWRIIQSSDGVAADDDDVYSAYVLHRCMHGLRATQIRVRAEHAHVPYTLIRINRNNLRVRIFAPGLRPSLRGIHTAFNVITHDTHTRRDLCGRARVCVCVRTFAREDDVFCNFAARMHATRNRIHAPCKRRHCSKGSPTPHR